jgi:hypothetical protein
MNENAFERERITVDDVAAAPMLADPFTAKHVCLRTDGGGAVVLASERVARDCAKEPVWILGAADATSHVSMSEWGDFTTSAAAQSGPRAFAQAGVNPADIDICQLYDSFTSTVLLTVEDLGFCSSVRARFAPAASFRRTPTAADWHRVIPECAGCSFWSRPSGSCAGNADSGRSTKRVWRVCTRWAVSSPTAPR